MLDDPATYPSTCITSIHIRLFSFAINCCIIKHIEGVLQAGFSAKQKSEKTLNLLLVAVFDFEMPLLYRRCHVLARS